MLIHVWPTYIVLINLILNVFEVENVFTYSVALITNKCFRTCFHSTSLERPESFTGPTNHSVKLVFSYVVKGVKVKITAKFRDTAILRFEDTKRIMSPEKIRAFRETSP